METGTVPCNEIEFDVIRPDRTRRHVISRGGATRDATGAIVGLFGKFIDVTERDPFAIWQKDGELVIISADGTVIEAGTVVSACDPHATFLSWLHGAPSAAQAMIVTGFVRALNNSALQAG